MTPTAAPTADELYVAWLYDLFLGRDVDAAGLAHWTGELGRPSSRGNVVSTLRRSPEAIRHRDIAAHYVRVLGRAPGAAERDHWYGEVRRGLPRWKVEANVIASAEARNLAGSDADWVRNLFVLTLGRKASSADVTYYTGRLQAGTGRGTLTGQVMNSREGARARVIATYREMLDRSGVDDEMFPFHVEAQWLYRQANLIEVDLAGSTEAYERVTGP